MDLLTIGAFARASRLSPKALRLYDDLGLLPPSQVDPATGYRFYDPAQLERARLVAWLRRLGMPLARIRVVCALEPAKAIEHVRTYWTEVERETAARRDLAQALIDHLSRPDQGLDGEHRLGIRYAVMCDIGLVRERNQDAAYASPSLLAVADGFGAGGAPASSAAIDALVGLADRAKNVLHPGTMSSGTMSSGTMSSEVIPSNAHHLADGVLNALQDALERANQTIGGIVARDEPPHVVGTTLTAMLLTGSELALVHIGDSRAYLLRDGDFLQITHDHTLVQSMVDLGLLSIDEAASHPQRALLLRAIDGRAAVLADVRRHEARPGDRYLLCSDGLSSVLPPDQIRRVVSTIADPQEAVAELMVAVREAGAPDNVSCVVADVIGPWE
jgi:serine/threonine protein phosphatase PrpC